MKKLAILSAVFFLVGCSLWQFSRNETYYANSCLKIAEKEGRSFAYYICETEKSMQVAMMVGNHQLVSFLREKYIRMIEEEQRRFIAERMKNTNPYVFSFLKLNGKTCHVQHFLLSKKKLVCHESV